MPFQNPDNENIYVVEVKDLLNFTELKQKFEELVEEILEKRKPDAKD